MTLAAQAPGTRRPSTAALLATRATCGESAAVVGEIEQLGHDGWLGQQLDPAGIDDSALELKLAAYPWLGMKLHPLMTSGQDVLDLGEQFKGLRLLRAVESKRQLLERLLLFWEDHFNVSIGRVHRFVDDATVWRPFAMGRFGDLLRAVSTSTSMVTYLGNQMNHVGAVNENLAREILELHTLGVTGPYTEDDVREFTRVLTGWNYVQNGNSPAFGDPVFRPSLHDWTPKTVLGFQFDGTGGEQELLTILDHLANHPSTIRFVVGKLARFFLGPHPPAQVTARAEAAWAASGGEMRVVLQALLSRSSFEQVLHRGATRFRRPFEWLSWTLRATGQPVPAPHDALDLLRSVGQAPFEWGPPNGFPDDRDSWNGLVASRWAVAASFARPNGAPWGHSAPDLLTLLQGRPRAQWVASLSELSGGGHVSASDRLHLYRYVTSLPATMDDRDALGEILELFLSCPSAQTH